MLSKFSDHWPIYWLGLELGHTSVTSLDTDIIGRQFEKSENGNRFEIWDTGLRTYKRTDFCDVEIEHGFEDWTSIRGWISI